MGLFFAKGVLCISLLSVILPEDIAPKYFFCYFITTFHQWIYIHVMCANMGLLDKRHHDKLHNLTKWIKGYLGQNWALINRISAKMLFTMWFYFLLSLKNWSTIQFVIIMSQIWHNPFQILVVNINASLHPLTYYCYMQCLIHALFWPTYPFNLD